MAGRDTQRGNGSRGRSGGGQGGDAESQESPVGRLMTEARQYVGGVVGDAVGSVGSKAATAVKKLVPEDAGPVGQAVATGVEKLEQGESPLSAVVSGGLGGVKEKVKEKLSPKRDSKKKIINILESVDVGVPVSVAYNQWTQFHEFPNFMKGVESAERSDEDGDAVKVNWKAKVAFSHRTWQSTIIDQIPDERISWRSEGPKGTVDGAVTFHEYGPSLTRVIVLLEYHPQGFVEKTGNLWRAQGRRARLDLKNFARFVMTKNEATGFWRGEIRDGDLVRSHDEVVEEEDSRADENGAAHGETDDARGGDHEKGDGGESGDGKRKRATAENGERPEGTGRGKSRQRESAGSR